MNEQELAKGRTARDVQFFRAQIRRLSPPRTDREEQLLEIYEQLLEKHAPPGRPESPSGPRSVDV